jgi:hypothetical protein
MGDPDPVKQHPILRWTFGTDGEPKMLVIVDGDRVISGAPDDLQFMEADDHEDAMEHAKTFVEVWTYVYEDVVGPEEIPRSELPSARPISEDLPRLSVRSGGSGSTTGSDFGAMLLELRDSGSATLYVDEDCFLPHGDFLRAVAKLELPHVAFAKFAAIEYRLPYWGPLSALLTSCPNLVELDMQGYGDFDPVEAEFLTTIRIWDAHFTQAAAQGIAKSRFPRLTELEIKDEGAGLEPAGAQLLLERAAPNLTTLKLEGFVDGITGVLAANAPRLEKVSVRSVDFEEFVRGVETHGIPKHWRHLYVGGYEAYLENAERFLARHSDAFSHLETFELEFEFDDPDEDLEEDEILRRLQAKCPYVTGLSESDD